jgi:hypothetical protein
MAIHLANSSIHKNLTPLGLIARPVDSEPPRTQDPIAFGTGFDVRAERLGALGLAGGAVRERLSATGEGRVGIISAHG